MGQVMPGGSIQTADARGRLSWFVAQLSKHDGVPSGDAYLIKRRGGQVVFAVADGSGSGPAAQHAAHSCLGAVGRCTATRIDACFESGHQALLGTRGAALGIAQVDLVGGRLSWAAVGDIDGLLLPAGVASPARHGTMIQRGGTLGYSYPGVHIQHLPVGRGDLIVLSSDGILRRYREGLPCGASAEQAAETMVRDFGRPNDDRLALAIRVGGGP